jgi:protein TonB
MGVIDRMWFAAEMRRYVSDDDYPHSSIRNEERGRVGFRLSIERDGSVSACTVISSSGWPSLDEATCRIMTTRFRLMPPHDIAGHSSTDSVTSGLSWALPDWDAIGQ